MERDFTQDAWFAGFSDGEATFLIHRSKRWLTPYFRITLRDDDASILMALRCAFGGRLWFDPDRRRVEWSVSGKESLQKLASYFERFPLSAKKQRDCAVWLEAVRLYLADGGAHPQLVALKTVLEDGRRYESGALLLSPVL